MSKTAENSTMIERLQTNRWSADRWAIYHLNVKEVAEFPVSKNAGSLVCRMNDAFFGERKWQASTNRGITYVTRIQ